MLPGRQIPVALAQENPLWISWHDSLYMATLTPQTVMDYFCRKSNPFYEHTCNNEIVRMQRLSEEHLNNMIGVEYVLLHVSEPVYVIRKQHRHSPTEATPMADYYIIGGTVYKAPDLSSVINSRILSAVSNLSSAFEEVSNYARYQTDTGYSWDFSGNKTKDDKAKTKANDQATATATKEPTGTAFQLQRVDMLLAELVRKFPPPVPSVLQQQMEQQAAGAASEPGPSGVGTTSDTTSTVNAEGVSARVAKSDTASNSQEAINEPKVDNVDMKPPPEKKPKT